MADIKDTKEMISLIAALAKAFKEAKADGTVNALDLGLLLGVIPNIAPALDGVSSIPEELSDLDTEEIAELALQVKSIVGELSSDNKYVEVAESAVRAGYEIYKIIQILKDT